MCWLIDYGDHVWDVEYWRHDYLQLDQRHPIDRLGSEQHGQCDGDYFLYCVEHWDFPGYGYD